MRHNLRNANGDFFCYSSSGAFEYEWVPEAVLKARGYAEMIIYADRQYAESKIQEARSPKESGNMVRPDYPDMTGAYAAPETQAYLDYAEANFITISPNTSVWHR